MDNLNNNIELASSMISKGFIQSYNRYYDIYPFTTENINGYIDKFKLKNKTLLTVGSSGDQILNACLKGCNNITSLDLNPFVRYYLYLKIAAINVFDLEEYHDYLAGNGYNNNFFDTFNRERFKKLTSELKTLDYESYIFWCTLYDKYEANYIRDKLFQWDEYSFSTLKKTNTYMSDINQYKLLRRRLEELNVDFITSEIDKVETSNKYDNIWLSNIGVVCGIDNIKKDIDERLFDMLNPNGELLASYIYDTYPGMKLKHDWAPIYDLEYDKELFKDYNLDICLFDGIEKIEGKDRRNQDCVLNLKK